MFIMYVGITIYYIAKTNFEYQIKIENLLIIIANQLGLKD